MEQKLYDLMDWAGIEELTYSESADPHRMLGPHVTEEGLLIQAFIPTATAITVKLTGNGKKYPMELADEAGFYAVLIPRKTVTAYTLLVTYDNGTEEEIHDPYSFGPLFTEEELKKFGAGIYYDVYEKMGAHPMTIDGIEGVYFAVWAPCAMRVSVVGDFNLWDGRRHQMRKVGEGDASVFELFIPGLKVGCLYKYEIKTAAGLPMMKADPYGNYAELRPNNASIVWDINTYQWKDKKWMDKRAVTDTKDKPLNIYEVHLGSWMRKEIAKDENGEGIIGSEFYNYRELAVKLAEYVKDMGYTHVELLPVMEHPLDASWGYQVTGYYAPTSRYGTPDDFMYFMDYMHEQGIGVILDWVPAHFPRDAFGMACFDGTCVYEHADPRKGSHPHWGTLIYNYGRPGVSNFLIANALFWAEKYHADGIRMDAVASMLYLDYGKNDGEWVANIYGGNENLEAVEFLKHLNTVFKGRKNGAILIAEESTAWPMITGDPKDGGLGFDYKWNMGWMNDFTNYMRCDPYFRKNNYGELTFSMLYAYSEDFVLVFSHDEVVHGKGSMMGKMPGETLEAKAENLRAAYGFMMSHPGKKLLFMGQDYGQIDEWNENASLEWDLLKYPLHKNMQIYVRELNKLYQAHPALYEQDFETEGFEWINCSYHEESMIMFVRRGKEETLLCVCNFDNVDHDKFRLGVPFAGKYKEIFNSDSKEFGGEGRTNSRVKSSRKMEWDERENSIEIHIPPMSFMVFSCTPEEKKESLKRLTTKKSEPKKLTTAKKSEPKKLATKKEEPKKLTTAKKSEPKKLTTKKAEPKKLTAAKKEEPKKLATAKTEAHKLETKKEEPKKLATAKTGAHKLETKKEEPKKLATAKTEAHKLETKKEEPKKLETVREEPKKLETAKTDPVPAPAAEIPASPEKTTPASKKAALRAAKKRGRSRNK